MAITVRYGAALVGVLWLTGCATATYEPAGGAPQAQPHVPEAPAPAVATEPAPVSAVEPAPTVDHRATVARIAARAQGQLAQAQYAAAIETAERGLRVDRYAADLYRILAEGYMGLGVVAQARNFAQLGLRYVGANAGLKLQLERLANQ